MLGLLTFQFMTGMALNLFETFPVTPNSTLSGIFGAMMTPLLSVFNLAIGFLVSILSLVIFAIFIDSGKKNLAKNAGVGLASVALAGVSGLGFVYSGFQNNIYSYAMAMAFVSAFISYSALLASYRNRAEKPQSVV